MTISYCQVKHMYIIGYKMYIVKPRITNRFLSGNQLFCFYLITDSLFGFSNNLLSLRVKKVTVL